MNPHTSLRPARRRQGGIASIELGIILTVMVIMLVPTFVIANALWKYTVLKHATDNAARYVAALPLYQLSATDPDPRDIAKSMVAKAMIEAGIAPASEEAALIAQIDVYCPGVVACRSKTPDTIVVGAYMTIADPASMSLEGSPWVVQTISTVPYGN